MKKKGPDMQINRLFFIIIIGLIFLTPVFLSAQTAEDMEMILDVPAVSYDQAARFVLGATEGNPEVSAGAPGVAFDMAKERGWLPKKAAADDPATIKGVSFLMMKAFDIKGNLLYTIFKAPRYAFRTLESRSLLQGTNDPGMKVSGVKFLQILGNVLNVAGGEE